MDQKEWEGVKIVLKACLDIVIYSCKLKIFNEYMICFNNHFVPRSIEFFRNIFCCYEQQQLMAFQMCLVVALPSHLVPSFFKCLMAPPPPIVVWLPCCFTIAPCCFIIAPCCYALLIGTPSSFSCASGGTWSNINKLHPIEVFFFPNP
jgi:hypothetical protein